MLSGWLVGRKGRNSRSVLSEEIRKVWSLTLFVARRSEYLPTCLRARISGPSLSET